jgi:hypothetical protein
MGAGTGSLRSRNRILIFLMSRNRILLLLRRRNRILICVLED